LQVHKKKPAGGQDSSCMEPIVDTVLKECVAAALTAHCGNRNVRSGHSPASGSLLTLLTPACTTASCFSVAVMARGAQLVGCVAVFEWHLSMSQVTPELFSSARINGPRIEHQAAHACRRSRHGRGQAGCRRWARGMPQQQSSTSAAGRVVGCPLCGARPRSPSSCSDLEPRVPRVQPTTT
jgi:hypothetical protein